MKGKHAKTTAKKLKLAKRTLALCFAAVFLCSCMLPVFATGSSLTDALREAVEETTSSVEESTGSTGGTMMDSFQSYYADYIAEKATTYRFWLDEKDSYDLDGITSTSASELAQYDDFYKVVKIENNAPLSAPDGFKNPTDPTGAGRKFEGWYYIDTYGLTQTFTFSGDIQSIDTDSTVDVFAKWGEAPAEEPATKDPEEGKTTKDDSAPPYPLDDGGETASEEETADDEIMTASLYDDMVSVTAATDANYTVSVGNSITVTGTAGWPGQDYHTWKSSDSSVVTVSMTGTGETAIVTGKKAGTATLTHTYWSSRYRAYVNETITVKVTASGSSSGGTTVKQPRSTKFTFDITDADVIYVHYDSKITDQEAGELDFNTVTDGFTTDWDHAYDNYWLFFVKPHDNYMVTGIGASGTNTEKRNDIYSVDGDYTNIARYPGIAKLVERAKALGYVGMFGYSRNATDGNPFTEASINVMGEQPPITVEATSDKTEDVKPDDNLTFTVKITPGHTGNKATVGYTARETVEDAEIERLLINGVDYKDSCTELVPHKNASGEIEYYTTTVPYTATRQDCNNGLVRLEVEASVKYNVRLNTQDNDTVKTEATIRSTATTDCLIAPQSDVRYVVSIENKPTSYPEELNEVPVDSKNYYVGEMVYTETEWPEKKVIDAENGGVWIFDGWYLGTEPVTEAQMVDGGLVFHGTWKFTKTMSSFMIAKSVIGNMGDLEQEFNFTIEVKNDAGQPLNFKLNGEEKTGTADFTLKNGQSVPLVSVPMGATVTISEDAEGYKINAKLGGSDYLNSTWLDDNGEFTFTVATSSVAVLSLEEDGEEDVNLVLQSAVAGGAVEEGNVITIVNKKDMEVPTGVILDTLPYILMLAAVGAGVVIFIFRKRHHDDD